MSVYLKRKISECDGSPMTTAGDIGGGMGNAVPASTAGMTAVEQSSMSTIGSGDNFGSGTNMAVQASPLKFKKRFKVKRKK